jgi:hypothetical protein
MWRSTERASLEKKPSMRLSQEPGGREGEFEAMGGLPRDPGSGLSGDVRGMIVEDQLDGRVGRIGGMKELEESEEFAAAMTVPDQGMNLAADKVDASQHRAVAFVFKLACERGVQSSTVREDSPGPSLSGTPTIPS